MAAVLSSALRKDSIDFRSDDVVRCKISCDSDSTASFAGLAGAKVTLAGIANPTSDFQAATKYYVDTVASGLTVKGSVQYSVEANLDATYADDRQTLSGETPFMALASSLFDLNPDYGATLQLQSVNVHFAAAYAAIEASADEGLATKFLVRSQTEKRQNGVYFLAASSSTGWTLRRAASFNDDPSGEIKAGSFVFVTSGFKHPNRGFVLVADDGARTLTIAGAANKLDFQQFSGAGQISAGTNLNKDGDTINLNAEITLDDVTVSQLTVEGTGAHAQVSGTMGVSGSATLAGPVKAQAKTFVGCGALQPDGSATTRAWTTDKVSDGNGGHIWDVQADADWDNKVAADDATLVVGGSAYFDNVVTARKGAVFNECSSINGVEILHARDNAGEISSSIRLLPGLNIRSYRTPLFLEHSKLEQIGYAFTNTLTAPTEAQSAMLVRAPDRDRSVDKYWVPQYDNDTGTWTSVFPHLPVTGVYDDYSNAALIVDGKAFVDGKLIVTGALGANVQGPVDFGSTLSVTGSATLAGPVKAQAKTFVGCGVLQPNGEGTARAWVTDKVSDGSGGYIWDVQADPAWEYKARVDDAALVVGGSAYFDNTVHAERGVHINQVGEFDGGLEVYKEKGTAYEKTAVLTASGGLDLSHGGATLTKGTIKQKGNTSLNSFGAPTLAESTTILRAAGHLDTAERYKLPIYDADAGTWSWLANAAWPIVELVDDYSNAALIVDGKAFVDGQLIVRGSGAGKGVLVEGAASLGSLTVTGTATFQGTVTYTGSVQATTPGQVLADLTFGTGSITTASAKLTLLNVVSIGDSLEVTDELYVSCTGANRPASWYLAQETKPQQATVLGCAYVSDQLAVEGRATAGSVYASSIALFDAKSGAYEGAKSLRAATSAGLTVFAVADANATSVASAESWTVTIGTGASALAVDAAATFSEAVTLDGSVLTAAADGQTLADFTFSAGSIASSTATIDFNANDLTTTGDVSAANVSFTTLLSGAAATFTSDCTAMNFFATSDVNLKTEIRQIEGAVAQCQKLRGVEFKWKGGDDQRDQLGVIAQEVEGVYPALVAEVDGHKRVDYGKLVGLLIEAVKELKAEGTALRAELEELRGTR